MLYAVSIILTFLFNVVLLSFFVAGQIRVSALQRLMQEKKLDPLFTVPVRVISEPLSVLDKLKECAIQDGASADKVTSSQFF